MTVAPAARRRVRSAPAITFVVHCSFRRALVALAALVLGACAPLGPPPPTAPALPADLASLRVAARWSIGGRDAFLDVMRAFPAGGRMFDHALVASGDGRPRRVVDRGYDGAAGELAHALHALLHRTQYDTRLTLSDAADVAERDRAAWRPEWSRLQYEGTPCRIGAVWFRRAVGACNLWERRRRDLCPQPMARRLQPDTPAAIAPYLEPGTRRSHDAIRALRADHPGLGRPTAVRRVVDHRHRIELRTDDEAVYELALGQVRVDDGEEVRYVAELAIVAAVTEARVRRLLAMVAEIETRTELALTPIETDESGPGGVGRVVPACR